MIAYVGLIGWKESMTVLGMLGFAIFVSLLFACVLLHEFGHALTARRYGVSTKDIIISPIGGVARLYRMPEKPMAEFWVALMGPAVNVAIAIFLAILISLTPLSFAPVGRVDTLFSYPANMAPLLMWINIGLVIFNLIPAFPMDGGRIFRSLLSLRWSPLQSTRIASFSGQCIAAGFIFYGLYQGEYILPFIGVFVFVTAVLEYRNMKRLNAARAQNILALTRPLKPLFADDPVQKAWELADSPQEGPMIVLDHTYQAIGYLDITTEAPTDAYIADHMVHQMAQVHYTDSIATVAHKFESQPLPLFAVCAEDHVLGIIRQKDIL